MACHRLTSRDHPVRERRREFRRRTPRRLPARLDPLLIERLIAAALSWRDKAILTLLCSTGQRIGDWSDEQILGALRQGVAADGRHLLPPMGS
jgi:integrase